MSNASLPPHQQFECSLLQRIADSEYFRSYQNAFRTATGLMMRLISSDPELWHLNDQKTNLSPFCQALNLCQTACGACLETNRRLLKETEVNGPSTCKCFAGLCETAVPLKLGASIIGYLKTGQVFTHTPTEEQFNTVLDAIGRKTLDPQLQETLKEAYFQTRQVNPLRYQSMVTLLESFAEQLSAHADSMAIIDEGSEPTAIAKARKYIHSHLDERLPLSRVASHAGLSESHFCRLFKDAAGLTLTDYITRCRIDWAKRELLNPETRISEIAFLVGYQSLSQFNRSFARTVGQSPTLYRRERLLRAAS